MSQNDVKDLNTIPYGRLGIIAMDSCAALGKKVDNFLIQWRKERELEHKSTLFFDGYERDSYLIGCKTPRFGSGEARGNNPGIRPGR